MTKMLKNQMILLFHSLHRSVSFPAPFLGQVAANITLLALQKACLYIFQPVKELLLLFSSVISNSDQLICYQFAWDEILIPFPC